MLEKRHWNRWPIVTPETILMWHIRLIVHKFNNSKIRVSEGNPLRTAVEKEQRCNGYTINK